MITVHHLEHSQAFRIVWLLEELGLEYNLKLYKRNPDDTLAPPELKALSPLGTSPVITDGSIVLAESNAIIDYVLDKAPESPLRPLPSSAERVQYLFWFHAAQSSFQTAMTVDSVLKMIPSRVPWPVTPIAKTIAAKTQEQFVLPRVTKVLDVAEGHLSTHAFLAGPYLTAADITSIYPFDSCFERYPKLQDEYPKSFEWLERLRQRPAFQEAQKKVGEDHVAVKVPSK